MTKSEFYDMYGSGFDSLCVGSERDPRKHAQMKKSLSAAFSTKALVQQESIVRRCVDGFVRRLGADGACEKGLNMTKWFEMIAFDILGEMAFGETFHCIENGKSIQQRRQQAEADIHFLRKTAFLVRDDCQAPVFRHGVGQLAALPADRGSRAKVSASSDSFRA